MAEPGAARVVQVAVEVPDPQRVERDVRLRGELPGGFAPGLAVLAGDQQEAPGRDEVLDRAAVAVLVIDPGVRQGRTRAGGRLVHADVVGRRGCGAAVGHDGGGLVAVAVLDVELAELHRLRAHRAQHARAVPGVLGPAAPHPAQSLHVLLRGVVRGDPERRADFEVVDRVLQRALAVTLIGRPPLGLVGVEQLRRRVAAENHGQLPAQILRVVDRAGQAQPAGGRMAVRRVPEQEHAAGPERGGQHRLDRPALDLVDFPRRVRNAQRLAGVGLDLRVGLGPGIASRVVQVDNPLLRLGSPQLGAHRDHHHQDAGLRGEDPADQHVRIRRPLREVSGYVQGRGLRDHPEPFVRDTHQARDPPPAVGPDQVLGAHHVTAAGGVVADRGPYALVVLLQVGQLMAEADPPRRELFGPRLQQRLEADLRQVQLTPRARRPPALVRPGGAPALQPRQAAPVIGAGTGETRVESRRRHLPGWRAALRDRAGDAHIVEHLHGPLVQDMGLGQVRGLRARADQQMPDPLTRQQHGSGQARAAAAHDKNRNFLVNTRCVLHRSTPRCFLHRSASPPGNWSEHYNKEIGVSTPKLEVCWSPWQRPPK